MAEPDSGRFRISDLNSATAWTSTDFATAEGWPDDLKATIADLRQLWLFGDETSEVWANTGNADFPFERGESGFIQKGIVAPATARRFDNTLVWLSKDDRGQALLVMANGNTPVAIVIVYAISLPFYVFVPVPERWSFPDSGATLLSDRWSSRLIETFRPISGLDNCLPSSHVSLTVVVVWVCYAYRFRLRTVALALGLTVVLATFVLGIHWLADIVAGLAVGVVGVGSARRIDRFLLRPASTRGVGGR